MNNIPLTSLRIHQFLGIHPGTSLLVLGAVHGNETCGSIAIKRIQDEIENGTISINRGILTMIPITNPLAFQNKRREGQRNLNRNFKVVQDPKDYEDHICNLLYPMLLAHDVLLDLHSFQSPGIPFAMIGPTNNNGDLQPFMRAQEEEAFAMSLGVHRFVEGWMEVYAKGVNEREVRGVNAKIEYGIGTAETMRQSGGISITLECGQHDDILAPQVAYKAIRRALHHLGLTPQMAPFEQQDSTQVIRLYKVVDRLHHSDEFCGAWRSFDKVKQDQVIAYRANGQPLLADEDGWIVFPNPSAQVNQEWFYLAKDSSRFGCK